MYDFEIRQFLHLNLKTDIRKTFDEVELNRGSARIDILAIDDCMHGFEIKSDHDTLNRLEHQIKIYNMVFDKVTLVVGEKYLNKAKLIIPDWWGIILAEDTGNEIKLVEIKNPEINSKVNPRILVQLLWRDELKKLLKDRNSLRGFSSKNKNILGKRLIQVLSIDDLKLSVRETLKNRVDWKVKVS